MYEIFQDRSPVVSVIVPVYNAEAFLHRCLDSLVYQTLKEIEIIAVDNCSSDRTWDILNDYAAEFPNKIRIFKLEDHYDGPGAGRNKGLKEASAEYIGFADSDDYFEYHAFELMYNKAVSENCDMVYTASFDVKGSECKLTRALRENSKKEILTMGSMVFWNKLIHRSLFQLMGKIPEDIVFEDLAYCPGLISYATKIGYIDKPLYYYIIREDSGVNTLAPERVLKSLEAERYALENCNPEYLDYFADSVAMRLCNDIRDRWQFTDSYIKQLKTIRPYLEKNDYFKRDKRNYDRVQQYYRLSDTPIPCIVYLNGFGSYPDKEFIEKVTEKAFWEGAQIRILNQENCNIEENSLVKRAFEEKKYDLVGSYFALKKIYETGGVFIGRCIKIVMTFNCLRYLDAFFCYLNNSCFSDQIFGAAEGNETILRLLRTYEKQEVSDDFGPTLSNRIKELLILEYDMPLKAETNLYQYPVAVLGPGCMAVDNGEKMHMAWHDYKEHAGEDGFVTIVCKD